MKFKNIVAALSVIVSVILISHFQKKKLRQPMPHDSRQSGATLPADSAGQTPPAISASLGAASLATSPEFRFDKDFADLPPLPSATSDVWDSKSYKFLDSGREGVLAIDHQGTKFLVPIRYLDLKSCGDKAHSRCLILPNGQKIKASNDIRRRLRRI